MINNNNRIEIRNLQQQLALFKSKVEISDIALGTCKKSQELMASSIKKYEGELDTARLAQKRVADDMSFMSQLLTTHAIPFFPQRIQLLRATNDFNVVEMRAIELDIWGAMLQRLRNSKIVADALYTFSSREINGERVLEHRKDLLLMKHPADHWLVEQLQYQVLSMVTDLCYRLRFAAPWYVCPDTGNHRLWWWRHPSQGLMQSEHLGIQSAFQMVHGNIVHRFLAQASHKSSDKMGDEYFRDHAAAIDRVMSSMQIGRVTDQIKDAIVARYVTDAK